MVSPASEAGKLVTEGEGSARFLWSQGHQRTVSVPVNLGKPWPRGSGCCLFSTVKTRSPRSDGE